MKNLLFRQEHKNRRISKIKSKLYHKLKKREKEREEKKLLDYLEQIDPEAAEAYRMKEEMKKVEERLKLRHASNNKFAKTLKRFGGGVESENVREAFNDMMKEKQALRQRTKTVQKTRKALDSDEDSDESFESGSDSDSEAEIMDKAALKKQAISQIEKELMDLNDEDGDSENQSDD